MKVQSIVPRSNCRTHGVEVAWTDVDEVLVPVRVNIPGSMNTMDPPRAPRRAEERDIFVTKTEDTTRDGDA
mgnify:CR=1 FL=1